MSAKNRTGCMIVALLLSGAAPAFTQNAPSTPEHVPLQKTIGQNGPDIVPSLIVMNARGASLQGGKLILTGVSPNSIVFADRPVQAAGHTPTKHLMEEWAPNNQSDETFNADGTKIRDAVVTLKTAKLEGDKLTFDVDVLEGDLAGGDAAAALFIDRFGVGGVHAGGFRAGGFHGGYARVGVGRVGAVGVGYHPYVARGAWYRGAPYAAAAVGGAALGAAAVGAAAANAYPYCGYPPYPPCY